jgi:hypothetical protein
MSTIVFDVSLYGDLRVEHLQSQVLTEYAAKSILAPNDALFQHSDQGARSLDFIDPQEAHDLASRGTIIVSV